MWINPIDGKSFHSKGCIKSCHPHWKVFLFGNEYISDITRFETSLTRCEAFPFIYFYLRKKKKNYFVSVCASESCVCVLGSLNKLTIYRKWFLCSHTFDSIEICSENQFVCKIGLRLLGGSSINCLAGPKFYLGTIVHVL